MPLSDQNIESELSYAYLHAVASKAGINCKSGNRHDDNSGVDAIVDFAGPLGHPYLTEVQINIQLKATVKEPATVGDFYSYALNGIKRYNQLRKQESEVYRVLVVLFLDTDTDKWLTCTADELILKKSAYWVCRNYSASFTDPFFQRQKELINRKRLG